MLNFELTKNHTGIILWGDYDTLERLHEFVHKVVANSILMQDKESFILGLAYDVRKAIERQRRESHKDCGGDQIKIYGVEILWPVILVQLGVLRHAMSYMTTNRLDQAIMFELEHVVELATHAAMPSTADEIMNAMRHTGVFHHAQVLTPSRSHCDHFRLTFADARYCTLAA